MRFGRVLYTNINVSLQLTIYIGSRACIFVVVHVKYMYNRVGCTFRNLNCHKHLCSVVRIVFLFIMYLINYIAVVAKSRLDMIIFILSAMVV